MMVCFHANLRLKHLDLAEIDTFFGEVLVLFQIVVPGTEVPMRRAGILLEGRILLTLLQSSVQHTLEISTCEDAVMRDPMVVGMGLKVMQVREAGGILISEDEGQEGISVVDCIAFLTI